MPVARAGRNDGVRDEAVGAPPLSAFGVGETHGILRLPGHRILAASDGLGWGALYAARACEVPYEASFGAVRDHLLILHLEGQVHVQRSIAGERSGRMVAPGGLFLLPGGVDFGVRLGSGLSTLHLYLRDAVLREVAEAMVRGDPARVELRPLLGDHDPLLEALARGIGEALEGPGPAEASYVDYLTRGLAARLLLRYSAAIPAPTGGGGGLSRIRLARVADYIEANLERSIGLTEMAAVAALSPVHFARQFRLAMGQAPHQHLLHRRVERAKRLLAAGDLSIAEIAYHCGFSHQEHLTRMFRRAIGTTPATFRRASAR
jgi:AraC family transcriptional regulator